MSVIAILENDALKKDTVMKVNTSVQCGTQVEDLDQVEYLVDELGQSDARMSVSIQVT